MQRPAYKRSITQTSALIDEYLTLHARIWCETFRMLTAGGRACANVANLGRKPYIPLHSHISSQIQESGFLMRGEIIWNNPAGNRQPSSVSGA